MLNLKKIFIKSIAFLIFFVIIKTNLAVLAGQGFQPSFIIPFLLIFPIPNKTASTLLVTLFSILNKSLSFYECRSRHGFWK